MARFRSSTGGGLALVLLLPIFVSPFALAATQTSFAFGPAPEIGSYKCNSLNPDCPMGVADYGVNAGTKYSYVAEEIQSWTNFTKLAIGGDGQMTIQQNTVDYKVYEKGHAGEYWIQDVPVIIQTSAGHFTVQLEDNIWNFSAGGTKMSGTIHPNLNGDCSSTGGQPKFYFCVGAQTVSTTLPFEVKTTVQTGLDAAGTYKGDSVVTMAIHVYHSGLLIGGAQFDAVAFAGKAPVAARFQIGGFNPRGLNNDAETVLAGNCCGSTIAITSIGAHMSESYATSIGGTFATVPHAWSAGSDTAETVSGVHMKSSVAGTGIAASGTVNNIQLW